MADSGVDPMIRYRSMLALHSDPDRKIDKRPSNDPDLNLDSFKDLVSPCDYGLWERYRLQVQASKGFEIFDYPGNFDWAPLVPSSNLGDGALEMAASLALTKYSFQSEEYQSEEKEVHEFSKILRANVLPVTDGVMFYITFEAHTLIPCEAPTVETYYAKIWQESSSGKLEVKFIDDVLKIRDLYYDDDDVLFLSMKSLYYGFDNSKKAELPLDDLDLEYYRHFVSTLDHDVWEKYLIQVRDSGGFGVLTYTRASIWAPLVPVSADDLDDDDLGMAVTIGLYYHKMDTGKEYELPKILRANVRLVSGGVMYYITFEASERQSDDRRVATFQAKVWQEFPDRELQVKFCRHEDE